MVDLLRFNNTGKPRRPILSIRTRLIVLALLAVVPLMVDRVRLLESSRSERIEEVATEVLDLTRRGTDDQREIVTSMRAMLQIIARAYVTVMARGETCNFYLNDLAATVPWIKGLSIIGPDGRIKCATLSSAVGLDFSDRPHYREARATKTFAVGDYIMARVDGAPSMAIAYPVQAIDEAFDAVVVATIELQWVTSLVDTLDRRLGSSVLLIDRDGKLLASDPYTAKWVGTSLQDTALFKAIADRPEGAARAESVDGIRRIFGFIRVPWSSAYLVVGLDELDALRRINREVIFSYVQLTFIGILVLLLAWFCGERLVVRPIRSLARIATRLGRGDLDVRTDQQVWAKEFEPLAAALADMAQKLAHREKELRAANINLERLASRDALSGLANRRTFDERIASLWRSSLEGGLSVALLMIDVDYFKLFNDRYGHIEGDECLRRIANVLNSSIRGREDLSARYGGEEFALLLPGANAEQAQEVGDRLRRTVEDLHILHADSPLRQVTISIGVAAMVPTSEGSIETLLEAADAGLYAAKRRGRNTVVVHGPITRVQDSVQIEDPLDQTRSVATDR
jgi:diguanylate cyclase (GGDEF)-like protein